MKYEPIFNWNEDAGVAECTISDGTNSFVGVSHCSPDDLDMKSEKVGCFIALKRSEVKYLKHIKNNEIIPGLKALKQLYYSMNRSNSFNPKAYENTMLYRQIRNKENDLVAINEMIADSTDDLKTYIKETDSLYEKIRRIRKAKSKQ